MFSSQARETWDEMDLDDPGPAADTTPIIVATDFGTTFSGIAWARRDGDSQPTIEIIDGYPDDLMALTGKPNVQVPTESWYSDGPTGYMPFPDTMDDYEDEDENKKQQEFDHVSDSEDDEATLHDLQIAAEQTEQPRRTSNIRWGYSAQGMSTPDIDQTRVNLVSRSKLLLDSSKHTADIRKGLAPLLKRLKRGKLIKQNEDVIADFLIELFDHAKSQMRKNHGITESNPVEHVLCVPAIWEAEACQRMQNALQKAIGDTGFGTIDGLFLVSEPEAAATRVLQNNRAVNEGDLFLILDAGGGTVDAITYQVTGERPLRLSKEVVPSDGCLFGSSFLNAYFRDHLRKRLEGSEDDITQNGYTVDGILDEAVKEFEKTTKRIVNVMDPNMPRQVIRIQGLRRNPEKRIITNGVSMNRNDFAEIFRPCVEATHNLMEKQLAIAKSRGYDVKKVLLVGGFGASTSLRECLRKSLENISRKYGYKIELITSTGRLADPETDVMCGAILRAWDKEHGPDRITQLSYGFEVTEEHEPDVHEAHKKLRGKPDKLDGRSYVHGTLDWVVLKGKEVPNYKEYSITVYRIVSATRKSFKLDEVLWISSSDPNTSTESHRRHTDPHNKGARVAGKITVDMTPIIQQGLIQPATIKPGYDGKPHYKIEFDLVIIINGRNLRYEARWPVGSAETRSQGQICIAAAFRPGTK